MADRPSLFAELKRRNVIRMAGLYLAGAWLLTQVASMVLPAFDVPSWVLRACFDLPYQGEFGHDSAATVAAAHLHERSDIAFQGDAMDKIDAGGATAPLLGVAETAARLVRGS